VEDHVESEVFYGSRLSFLEPFLSFRASIFSNFAFFCSCTFCRSSPFCSTRRFCARIDCRMECRLRAERFRYMIADFRLQDVRYVNCTCKQVCLSLAKKWYKNAVSCLNVLSCFKIYRNVQAFSDCMWKFSSRENSGSSVKSGRLASTIQPRASPSTLNILDYYTTT